jgi:hypothetical protein
MKNVITRLHFKVQILIHCTITFFYTKFIKVHNYKDQNF